jgi:peptide/nickel transport system ATP-binding protein/oligopeptide transport system ATP-binding protein
MSGATPLVEARGLVKSYAAHGGIFESGPRFRAVDGVDLVVGERETVGLVGESGSGKTTLGRMLVRLVDPDAGTIRFAGADLLALSGCAMRKMRRQIQVIFQDPYGSLNPRMRAGTIVREPLDIHRIGATRALRQERAAGLLEEVGLDRSALDRFPHEFSGGQRQRIGIARAIACGPRFIVADEPVSALDASIQAQIVNLLVDLQERHGLAYLFIAHDLRVVRYVAGRVAVMYLGRIVEEGPTAEVYARPLHPYTRALLEAVPRRRPGDPPARVLAGEPPSPVTPPSGCRFRTRCPVAEAICEREDPALLPVGLLRRVACHLVARSG